MAKKGRPVKETPVTTDANLEVPNEQVAPQEKPAPKMDDTAYGVTKLPTGQHVLVRIKYDAVSGQVGVPELDIVLGGDRMDAEERMKIAIADELLEWG